MSIADEIIRLGHQLDEERNAAYELWSWLPSRTVAERHHGDYYANFTPSVSDILKEAAMVMAENAGHETSEQDRKEWFEKCPCGEGCEEKGC
jgi:hypothetical protein